MMLHPKLVDIDVEEGKIGKRVDKRGRIKARKNFNGYQDDAPSTVLLRSRKSSSRADS